MENRPDIPLVCQVHQEKAAFEPEGGVKVLPLPAFCKDASFI